MWHGNQHAPKGLRRSLFLRAGDAPERNTKKLKKKLNPKNTKPNPRSHRRQPRRRSRRIWRRHTSTPQAGARAAGDRRDPGGGHAADGSRRGVAVTFHVWPPSRAHRPAHAVRLAALKPAASSLAAASPPACSRGGGTEPAASRAPRARSEERRGQDRKRGEKETEE